MARKGQRRRPALRLKKRLIDSLVYQPTAGKDIQWDDDTPGFGVRLHPPTRENAAGRRTFVVQYVLGGRKRLMTLARYGSGMTVDQARERAQRVLLTARDGDDPLMQRSASRRQGTLRELAEAYLADREAHGTKTVATMRRRFYRNVPQAWLSKRAADLTRGDVRSLHSKIGRRAPYEANRLLQLLRPMFNQALSGELNDPDSGQWFLEKGADNPAEQVKLFREQPRKRFIHETELPALAKQIDLCPNVWMRGAIWVYLLVGVRKDELLKARRSRHRSEPWVDWKARTLELPDSKSGERQTVPLSGPALAILQAMPKEAGNPFLFPSSRSAAGHIVNLDKSWRSIRDAAGLEDVRLHDLRRTVGSWMTRMGVDLVTIKEAMRHAQLSTTLTYARAGEEPARKALDDHAARVMDIAGKRVVSGDQ